MQLSKRFFGDVTDMKVTEPSVMQCSVGMKRLQNSKSSVLTYKVRDLSFHIRKKGTLTQSVVLNSM